MTAGTPVITAAAITPETRTRTAEEVMAVPGSVRKEYIERMQGLIAYYRRELGLTGIDYCLLDTSQPLELGLMSYLMTRHRLL